MKKASRMQRGGDVHWVGDGFPVRTVFSVHDLGAAVSPFLLLDYAGPAEFAPSDKPRGVSPHPHRGFEAVTIVYSGEVEHRDSSGGGGRIAPAASSGRRLPGWCMRKCTGESSRNGAGHWRWCSFG